MAATIKFRPALAVLAVVALAGPARPMPFVRVGPDSDLLVGICDLGGE